MTGEETTPVLVTPAVLLEGVGKNSGGAKVGRIPMKTLTSSRSMDGFKKKMSQWRRSKYQKWTLSTMAQLDRETNNGYFVMLHQQPQDDVGSTKADTILLQACKVDELVTHLNRVKKNCQQHQKEVDKITLPCEETAGDQLMTIDSPLMSDIDAPNVALNVEELNPADDMETSQNKRLMARIYAYIISGGFVPMIKKLCLGCQIDSPSQKNHELCLFRKCHETD